MLLRVLVSASDFTRDQLRATGGTDPRSHNPVEVRTMTGLKSAVEIGTNLALAAAAVTLVWHLLHPAATPRAGEARAAVEDVESKGLSIALSAANRKGAPDADVVLLEFSDYQCPYC